MNDYVGKICPYCKTEFGPDDDIVICSNCEMPHHKDCWIENQGCTTFGCTGTIKSVNDSGIRQNNTAFCTKCGNRISGDSAFCGRCGARVNAAQPNITQPPVYTQPYQANGNVYTNANRPAIQYQAQNPYRGGGYNTYQPQQYYQITEVDECLVKMIGTKADYYAPKFQMLKAYNKIVSWNWPAFLVAPYWMIYRKMYLYGAAVLGVSFIFTLLDSLFTSFLLIVGYALLGMFANRIYLYHLENKAEQARAMNEPYRSQFIEKEGGVNAAVTALTALGYALLILIVIIIKLI